MTRASGYVGETKNQPTKATTTPTSAQEALGLECRGSWKGKPLSAKSYLLPHSSPLICR